jgi:hypothetical protein
MTWPMTWHPSGPVGHPVWTPRLATRRAPHLAPVGHPVWPPRLATRRAPCPAPVGQPVWPPRLATRRAPCPAPVGQPVWHPVRHPIRPSSGTPSGTPVLSRGSGRPSIYEPLDRCPFGPLTVALPFTYIKPSNPPLHHFLHSPICIGTYNCVATAALRGSWSLGAGSNCLGASPSNFIFSIYTREGWSLILYLPRMTVAATVTAREEEEEGAGSG